MTLKELKTWIKWIVGILILFLLILFFQCFALDKIKSIFGWGADTNKSTSISSSDESNTSRPVSSSSNIGNNVKEVVTEFKDGYNNAETYDYNVYNFDDRILMFGGENKKYDSVEIILNYMIDDAKDTFYSRPSARFQNCSGVENCIISASNGQEEYITKLIEAKNALNKNGKFDITFEYGFLHSAVTTIVITQK